MVLSYLNSMYVFYLMYSDIPSGGFSNTKKPAISADVEAILISL